MEKLDNKKQVFIKQLFLYYKPSLTKEKQIELLKSWIKSCVDKEEYEMASTLKSELHKVKNNIVDVKDIIELVPEEKPKKGWSFVNLWKKSEGFTFVDFSFSKVKKYFSITLLNYKITYTK